MISDNSLWGYLSRLTYIIACISEIPISLWLLIMIEYWLSFWILYRLLWDSIFSSTTGCQGILQWLLEVSLIVFRGNLIVVKNIYVLWGCRRHTRDTLVLILIYGGCCIMRWMNLLLCQMIFICILSLILNKVIWSWISRGFRVRILRVLGTCCLIHIWNILNMPRSIQPYINAIVILRSTHPTTSTLL